MSIDPNNEEAAAGNRGTVAMKIALALGGMALLSLFFNVKTVHHHVAWHWRLHETPLDLKILIVGGILIAGMITMIFRWSDWRRPVLLILCGITFQWTMGLSAGEGTEGLRKKITHSGHAEFAWTGSRPLKSGEILRNYDHFVENYPNQRFSKTKPPGQLISQIELGVVSRMIMPEGKQKSNPAPKIHDNAHRQLVDLLMWILPVLAALALWPMLRLSAALSASPLIPALLFMSCPAFGLIIMHYDQALYPLICLLTWTCIHKGTKAEKAHLWGAGAGILAATGTFISFSILPALVMCPFFAIAAAKGSQQLQVKNALRTLPAFICAFTVIYLWFFMQFDYDPIHRWQAVMEQHGQWKNWHWSPKLMGISVSVNILEYLWWAGPPAAFLFLAGSWNGIRRISKGQGKEIDFIALGSILVFTAMLLFGKTIGEVARLWLFMLPLFFMIASEQLKSWKFSENRSLAQLIMWQFLWTVALKYGQDFW